MKAKPTKEMAKPKRAKPSPPHSLEAEATQPLPEEPASQGSLESTESYELSDSSPDSMDPDFQEDPFCINCQTYMLGGDCGCTIPLFSLLEKEAAGR